MSSPITGSSFATVSAGQSLCDRLTNLLSLSSKLKVFFDWAFDSGGAATSEFKSMFLPPPGVIMAYYVSGSEDAVKAAVQNLSGGSSSDPFWRLCDGTNGTPDLRGRTIVGAGQGDGLTNRVFGSAFGAETVTLTASNIPDIADRLPTMKFSIAISPDSDPDHDILIPENESTWGFSGDTDTISFSHPTDRIKAIMTPKTLTTDPVQIAAPSVVLWYIMRTARTE